MPRSAAAVFAIIPAYARPELLRRALASLADQAPALCGAIVVNNSRDAETLRVAAEAKVRTIVLTPRCNLGTAGGIGAGLRAFLAIPTATHAWIMDDDAVATPGALQAMLAGMKDSGAHAAMPLLTDENDRVSLLPFRIPGKSNIWTTQGPKVAEFYRHCGDKPRTWYWAIWASLVISRRAVETIGFPRAELWSQFSDFEYTLRLTEKFVGVLAPQAICRHLPPASTGGAAFEAKLYAALQNGNYVMLRLPHGRRAARHWPGLNFRFLRHHRWSLRAWRDVMAAFFNGAVLRRPAVAPADPEEIENEAAAAARLPFARDSAVTP
jgi:GT2 family glycosyltransferase